MSGSGPVAGGGVETFTSSVRVEGRFTLAPFVDPRGGSQAGPEYRGVGAARVYVTATQVIRYKAETVTTTWAGDYVDAFSARLSRIDPAKGTYELGVDRAVRQEQPHLGKAMRMRQVTVNRYGTRVREEMRDGYAWSDDAGAGFGGRQPLPAEGLRIAGKLSRANGDFFRHDGGRWDSAWEIAPLDPERQEPLKAIAGGPYVVERGGTLNLDGWKSTGKIRSYKWTFAPADDDAGDGKGAAASGAATIPFAAGASKEGVRVPTVFLDRVRATLTVSDGQNEDSDSVVVTVKPRDYATPFAHRDGEQLHPASIPPRMIKGRDLRYAGGENVCAFERYTDKNTVHILHPGAKAGSWKDNGYVIKRVQDPGGPFDGLWFVADYALRVERQMLVNKYILPNGPPPVRTARPFYEANKALGNDVDDYIEAVRRHELLHSELMSKALKTNDPGPRVESFVTNDEAALQSRVDGDIQSAEDAIDKASADPLPSVGWKGKIAFPDDATDEYKSVEMEI